MEIPYLGVYEWIYEKILSSIVTPMFDFVISIINIAWGYMFQYILWPILPPVLQVVFYWVIRVVEVLGAFINRLQPIGYLMVMDCLEKASDTFIGLKPVTYYPNGRRGTAVTGSLLEMLPTSTAISEASKATTLGGVGIALLLAISGVAKSSFDLDFENKRPVNHMLKQLFRSALGASLIPFAVWFMAQLSMTISITPNTAMSFDDNGRRSTLDSTIFTTASVNATQDSENDISKWGTVELGEGFGFKMPNKTNPDFGITKEPKKNFYLNDTYERYTNVPNVVPNFDLSRFDYLMGGWTAIFLCVILFLCFLTVIRGIFEVLLLYLVSPYFVAMMPLDNGKRFKQSFGTFMGKPSTDYDTVALIRIYLTLMPLILRGGITTEGTGGENRIVMTALHVMDGVRTVYKVDSLSTGLANETAGRLEQESSRDAYEAAILAAAPFRATKNRLEQRVSGKLEKKIAGAGKGVGTRFQGGDPKGPKTRGEVRTNRLQSKPSKQPKFKKTVIYDKLKNSSGFTIGGHRPVGGRSRQLKFVSKATLKNVKKNTSKHINFENDKRLFKYGYDQFRKDNAFIRNKDGTVDFMYPAKRRSAVSAQRNEIAKVREEALSYPDPKERSRHATNWLQYQSDDKNSLMYSSLANRMHLERTFGCRIDKTPISSGTDRGQIAFYPEKPKPPNGTKLSLDKDKGDKR